MMLNRITIASDKLPALVFRTLMTHEPAAGWAFSIWGLVYLGFLAYAVFARNRHRLAGSPMKCFVPEAADRARFLDFPRA